MKKFITLLLILNLLNFCKAQKQTLNSYGSYIRSHCEDCNIGLKVLHSYQVNVYFSQTDTIPDSISFRAGINVKSNDSEWIKYGKSSQTNICNGLVRVIYQTDVWGEWTGAYANGSFEDNKEEFEEKKVWYKGKNIPDSFKYNIFMDNIFYAGGGYEINSSYFKDIPLVTIEKGKSNTINLFERDDENDSLVFVYNKVNAVYIPGVDINTRTGDVYIPGNLDTGYYTIVYGVRDYFVLYEWGIKKATTLAVMEFTLHVVNEKQPYFMHNSPAKQDEMGINYVYTLPTNNTVTYQADYINPKGLGNYAVTVPVTKYLKKAPVYTATKINDTLLRINITITLDSTIKYEINDVPFSTSIIVTTTDSLGNCKQDLTSFYITNTEPTNVLNIYKTQAFSIFPNPATNKLNIVFEGIVPQNLIANIYDSKGSLVKTETLINNEIAITNLSQGLYLLTIESEGKRYNSKFIKE